MNDIAIFSENKERGKELKNELSKFGFNIDLVDLENENIALYDLAISYERIGALPIPYIYIGEEASSLATSSFEEPVDIDELYSEILSIISGNENFERRFLGICINEKEKRLTLPNGESFSITRLELDIIRLLKTEKRVFSGEELSEKLKHKGKISSPDSIRVTISRLRGKFFKKGYTCPISNTFKKGYRLENDLKKIN